MKDWNLDVNTHELPNNKLEYDVINKNSKNINKVDIKNFKHSSERINNKAIEKLKESYFKNRYPKKFEIAKIAEDLSEGYQKIKNWFRTQRKKEFEKGTLKHDRKIVFSETENQILMKEFQSNPYPSPETYKKLTGDLKCKNKHLKNWFAYKRKLQKRGFKIDENVVKQEFLNPDINLEAKFKNNSYHTFNPKPSPPFITFLFVPVVNVVNFSYFLGNNFP